MRPPKPFVKRPLPTSITAWSLSRLTQWEKCNASAKYKFIDKFTDPGNEAMARGDAMHKSAEAYVKHHTDKFDPLLGKFKKDLAAARALMLKAKAFAELSITLNSKWEITGLFDDDAWLRIKVDLLLTDQKVWRSVDYKSGGNAAKLALVADGYDEQLELYSLGVLAFNRSLAETTSALWFIDHGKKIEREAGHLTRKDFDGKKLRGNWERRANAMMQDRRFVPMPGPHCRYCPFSRERNGPCVYT